MYKTNFHYGTESSKVKHTSTCVS